jgi:hypothetical protein
MAVYKGILLDLVGKFFVESVVNCWHVSPAKLVKNITFKKQSNHRGYFTQDSTREVVKHTKETNHIEGGDL